MQSGKEKKNKKKNEHKGTEILVKALRALRSQKGFVKSEGFHFTMKIIL